MFTKKFDEIHDGFNELRSIMAREGLIESLPNGKSISKWINTAMNIINNVYEELDEAEHKNINK